MNDWTFTKDAEDIWRLKLGKRTVYSVHALLLNYYNGDVADIWLEIIEWLRKNRQYAIGYLYPEVFMKGWEDELGRRRE